MIVFCCVEPASNKARDDDDEYKYSPSHKKRATLLSIITLPLLGQF